MTGYLKFYFGVDQNRNLIARPVAHTIICGGNNSGVRTLLDSFMVNTMKEYSAEKLKFIWFYNDNQSTAANLRTSLDRYTVKGDMAYAIESALTLCEQKVSSESVQVFIFDNLEIIDTAAFERDMSRLLEAASKSNTIVVFVSQQPQVKELSKEFFGQFPIRIVTRADNAEFSAKVLGNDTAFTGSDNYGSYFIGMGNKVTREFTQCYSNMVVNIAAGLWT